MSAALLDGVCARLTASARAIEGLVAGVDPDLARFRRAPDAWSILEILGHLGDEERLDFRTRVDYTLHRPGEVWPAIDPERWVREQDFNARTVDALLGAFMDERRRSLAWLAGLRDADWSRGHRHPTLGEFTAASMLCAWAAHDLLHIRQIARVLHSHLALAAVPNRLDYAGAW